ncbi:efflux RND transporter permease subunit [Candidatus Rariloculus sp.]|uniref:efflux RND transporter permease subunit n=1 Tax=Candidatus Rariloculus sp. TaxID=3101265 RepID=UPI003D141AFE
MGNRRSRHFLRRRPCGQAGAALDIAINTISLFVFVLAIGIIVDDAIVVAEHVHLERKKGTPGVVAAIRGTRRNLRQL